MPTIERFTGAARVVSGKPILISGKPDANTPVPPSKTNGLSPWPNGRENTIAYKIMLSKGALDDADKMRLKFDALVSHDITYVGIIQTARASGMEEFPLPYALTNCHNSLCAVGGTINEDDHAFGLSAAKKYGGIFVPANHAVIHQYAREKLAGCGKMILGSDSHTRYGCYGTLGIGEGGGELVKQLLKNTYDINPPEVVLVWLEGSPRKGVGPHDVALALIGETFPTGAVKNKILEFAGPGVSSLSMDFRIGIDVMTTETSCLSSIWETDGVTRAYYENIGRPEEFRKLSVEEGAYYDSMIRIDLSVAESMIALPFHPSKAYTVHELQREPENILRLIQDECNKELFGQAKLDLTRSINGKGEVTCEQGIIAGCAGGMYENISEASDILREKSVGTGYFDLSVYPSSTPIALAISRDGVAETLMRAGAVIKPAFCGPCFGAGDIPANRSLSIRHATRNFPNREGSIPKEGQIASVALMDARSIAATALNGGILCSAKTVFDSGAFGSDGINKSSGNALLNDFPLSGYAYHFDDSPYRARVYNGYGRPDQNTELRYGPNITDWPPMEALKENLLLKIVSFITDPVTTTDELIPSGETSSYRSNPLKLSEFTLSRKDPKYVSRAKAVRDKTGEVPAELESIFSALAKEAKESIDQIQIASALFAVKPGDGSAREQAASCQRVLGGIANFANEYATKRYRSNLINWGLIPFIMEGTPPFQNGDYVFIPKARALIRGENPSTKAQIFRPSQKTGSTGTSMENCGSFIVTAPELNPTERELLLAGSLINYNRNNTERPNQTKTQEKLHGS